MARPGRTYRGVRRAAARIDAKAIAPRIRFTHFWHALGAKYRTQHKGQPRILAS